MTTRTAPPAAIEGSVPAVRRCHSRRGLALRVVPLRVRLDEDRLTAWYPLGPDAVRAAITRQLTEAYGPRATTDDERRALTAWLRYAVAEEMAVRYPETDPHSVEDVAPWPEVLAA